MTTINTLEIYKHLLSTGYSDEDALKEVNFRLRESDRIEKKIDSKFEELKQWFKEAKAEFISQKLVSALGFVIIAIGGFILAGLWHLSLDIKSMDNRLDHVATRLGTIEQIVINNFEVKR